MKKILSCTLVLAISLSLLAGCQQEAAPPQVTPPVTDAEQTGPENTSVPEPEAEPVTLTISGSWTDCKAIETIGAMFTAEYPNCSVVYENVNDYYDNLPKRMDGEDVIDLFFTSGVQLNSEGGGDMVPYALDLNSAEGLDLSNTFSPLMENFLYRDDTSKLYSIPLGAEMRGMFVNKSLLHLVGIENAPQNQQELLTDCQILKDNGYIPMQGNPSSFGQWLIYPWICNQIANGDAPETAWTSVNERNADAMCDLFREPLEFLYGLSADYFYDYKTSQVSLNLFNESTEEDYARFFFNIGSDGDSYKKLDDSPGQIAFMPAPMSYISTMNRTKDDYESTIEYEFMPAPVGTDGGFVYLSPAQCIAANKLSPNVEWSIRFLNFLFTPENNKVFAEEFNVMPNVGEAFNYISTLYDVPENHISHLGQATFSWGFYSIIKEVIVETSKCNKPDTVKENGGKIHEFNYYLELLKEKVRSAE